MTKVIWVAEPLNKPKELTKKDFQVLKPKKQPKPKAIPKPTMQNGMSHISENRINQYQMKKK